ncbi:WYL domain-containing protein [Bacillus atrophaeus]|uniref:hypothetical protein n=1 Tax=Bacillus atrophaeus TaxID=1452 RepID=UPI002281086D|nr:hypothetical protein [Bacillus atrophaeus]MCY9109125.1 WYL domain-containing protein [Bacillus atrophaeus]
MNILIKRSLEDRVPIDIIYMKKDGSICKRTIIVKHQNSHDIKAFCCTKKQMRTFLLDSILSCAPVQKKKQFLRFAN